MALFSFQLCFFIAIPIFIWESTATPNPNSDFKCDVPDEWLGIGNRSRSFFPGTTWPNGIVKYELHSSLSSQDRVEAQRAFDDIQSKTCIRFQPRSPGEAAYTSIEYDPKVCGLGHLCRTGGYQYAKFGGICRNKNTMIHELGHNLCLGHEHTRRDRDDYLHFNGCNPAEIPGKDNFETRGHLYDYTSRMSYQCGVCFGGWPKMSGVNPNSNCGNSEGLSVMDADKINDLYNCQGCYAHRWRPIDALSDVDRRNMVQFGKTSTGAPLYLCRGYVGGTMTSGKYWSETGICYLPNNGVEHQLRSRAQVFTVPGGRAFQIATMNSKSTRVPVGRKANAVECYAAVADIDEDGKGKETSIGIVCADSLNRAYFPYWGKEVVRSQYSVIVC
ncbi:Zinc metalloproteinase nas-14 [Orchesella cincta]|uniref:Metalloendopeptidase n=1 Tax=Orchesella cincta TaxID=48709 RepID=A0A1D2M7F2_ORCCI|nr:Zinc metalloproteinase nas-14 [Orchesella cincta]